MEEDDGAPSGRASPPTPKKIKMESDEPKQLFKDEDHPEVKSDEIEVDDEDEDGSPQLPPLLDMIDFPPSSPLPPTPPLPSSPRDLDMEQQDSEDEGPPPGWDNPYQHREQEEQMLTPAALSAIPSDTKMEHVQEDARNGDGGAPELVASDTKVEEEQESDDEGPPPGWDSKCQPEPELQVACPTTTQSDVQQDGCNGDSSQSRVTSPCVPSDVKMEEQESEDEGPPPGWDSKCQQPESDLHTPSCPTISQSDVKTEEDVQQGPLNGDGPHPHLTSPVCSDIKMEEQESEDEGPPPGWDSKCQQPQPELQTPTITQSDIKTEEVEQDGEGPTQALPSDLVKEHEQESEDDEGPPPGWDSKPQPTIPQSDIKTQQDALNRTHPQPPHHTPTPLLPSDIKVEEDEHKHESDDEGPPPGWDSKFQPEPDLQTPNPTTPPLQSKNEEDEEEEDEGPPPGWGSTPTPQQESPSGGASTRMECEENKNVEAVVERPSKQHSLPPTPVKQQTPLHKITTTTNHHEMGQMVCGSCRRLLSYPIGARLVECGCCLEENYVLQEHEVGQVICGGCDVLLMYPYGAPKVRCVNCSTETEIGDQNRRPTLSQQQQRARRHLKRVQTSKC